MIMTSYMHLLRYYNPIRHKKQEGNIKISLCCGTGKNLILIFYRNGGRVGEKEGFLMKIIYDDHKKVNTAGGLAPWIRRLVVAWIAAVGVEYLMLDAALRDMTGLQGIAQMSAGRMLVVAAVVFLLVSACSRLLPRNAERWMIAGIFGVLAAVSVAASFTWAYMAVCLLVLIALVAYARHGWDCSAPQAAVRCNENKLFGRLTAVGALAFFGFVSAWTVCRVYSFNTPTFDFGIFAQMFHSMKTTGLPITTVERDGPLSHFAVHVSPIYYLLLPFYYIVPTPATLQVLQAAVLASAVIPLWKLGRHHNLPPLPRMLLCFVLLLYPAYAGGTSYDIHENAFLTPLILWLLYGIDRKNAVITAISAALTLMVKEDAAVYVAVIALYLMLRSALSRDKKWGLLTGSMMLLGAIGWFAAVTGYLAESGDGVMTYRYKNFMFDGSTSLVTVIKAVLLQPMKAVFECVDAEKLEFIGLTLLPLAGLPLLTRRYERFILLIPYILVNLMSDYQYQHDIFFQYTYGATACLIYLALVNLADWKVDYKRLAALGAALAIGLGCFCAQVLPKAVRYPDLCMTYDAYYDSLRSVLDEVPEDASVAATTFYTTYLSQRDTLYDIKYASMDHILGCEYVVLGVKDTTSYKPFAENGEKGYENFLAIITEEGYEKIAEHEGRLEVYQRSEK